MISYLPLLGLPSWFSVYDDTQILPRLSKGKEKKIGKCPFWEKKNQNSIIFPKLIREMPLFCNSIIRKSRFIEELDYVIVELSSALCHAGVADVAISN